MCFLDGVNNPAWVADEMSPENHPSIQTGSSMLSVNYENVLGICRHKYLLPEVFVAISICRHKYLSP